MKVINKKGTFEDYLFDINVKVAIAYTLLLILGILIYIAFFK